MGRTIRESIDKIPLGSKFLVPWRLAWSDYHYSAALYYDDDLYRDGGLQTDKLILDFHGSGASGIPPIENVQMDTLVKDGWVVLCVRAFGVHTSTVSPYRFGYGNVNNPHFQGWAIKLARWVQYALEYVYQPTSPFKDIWPNKKVPNCVLFGHSMGATAVNAWSAYSKSPDLGQNDWSAKVTGIFASAATAAGLGTFQWNAPDKVMNSTFTFMRDAKHCIWEIYNDKDPFCPPDFSDRYKRYLPRNGHVQIASAGDHDHYWINLRPDFWLPLVNDLRWMPQIPKREMANMTSIRYFAAEIGVDGKIDNKKVVYSMNPTLRNVPASLTKMATLLYAKTLINNVNNFPITLIQSDIVTGSGYNLKAGDTVSFSDAAHNLLLPSSNLTANAVARICGNVIKPNGGIPAFMEGMAVWLKSVGCPDTTLLNPHGLAETGQWTNAKDMAVLTCLMDQDEFYKPIWKKSRHIMKVTGADPRNVDIIHTWPDVSQSIYHGAKTGTLGTSFNVAGIYDVPYGKKVVVVIMGPSSTANRQKDSTLLRENIYYKYFSNSEKFKV